MFSSFSVLNVDIFGESHSEEIGVTIKGIPEKIPVSEDSVQAFVDRRKSGKGAHSTARAESDIVEFLNGVDGGKTNGKPITAIIKNTDIKSSDYSAISDTPRPSHADYAARVKFGEDKNLAGGGRFSGRLTAPLCIAGAIAKDILKSKGIEVAAYVSEIGGVEVDTYKSRQISINEIVAVSQLALPVISETARKEIEAKISEAREGGDSLGGVVECIISGLPVGLGNALFEGLEGRIASAVFAIPAVKGIEFGSGFDLTKLRGSSANDAFCYDDGKVVTLTNRSGGINGGISNGMPVTMRVAFRPTPSIALPQDTVNLVTKQNVKIEIKGRHDACIVPRAVPCVEAAAALVILDAYLESNMEK